MDGSDDFGYAGSCFSDRHHMAVAPERVGIQHFSDEIVKAGYDHTKELIRIR